jgi:flagellar FliL protein
MAEEQVAEESTEKPKKPIVKIALMVTLVVVLIVGAIVGTLAVTGFFAKKPAESADAVLDAHGGAGHGPAKDDHGKAAKDDHGKAAKDDLGKSAKGGAAEGPKKKEVSLEAQAKFEKSYIPLDDKKDLVANVAGSRKVMKVNFSLMTMYDDRVEKNVEKHRIALRSASLDVLRQVTEAEITKPDFRLDLAQRLRDRINAELERLEGFGGIEEVFFTEFVYQ